MFAALARLPYPVMTLPINTFLFGTCVAPSQEVSGSAVRVEPPVVIVKSVLLSTVLVSVAPLKVALVKPDSVTPEMLPPEIDTLLAFCAAIVPHAEQRLLGIVYVLPLMTN